MARYRTRYDLPLPASFRKSRTNVTGMWSKAVMSAPFPDLAGDVLVMQGMDFTLHKADPSVDLEHGRDRDVRGMPVAWMRASLSEPGGEYALEWARLDFAPDGEPADWHTVPVCTNYFDKSCRVSSQAFALVEQDLLPSVSVEFRPPAKIFMTSLGRSRIEPRDAYRFEKAHVCGLAICKRGVNPFALTLTKSLEAATQVTPALAKILSDRRIDVGGTSEPLCEVIYKALAPLAPVKTRTVVRVESKAMPMPQQQAPAAPPQQAPAPDADLDTQNEDALDDQAPASGGVAAKYAFAQAIADACDQYEADMQSSDSPELRKLAEKFRAMAEKLAGMVKGAADKHDAKLNGGPDGDIETDDDETEEGDEDVALESDDTDDDDSGDDDEPGKKKGKPFGKALARDDDGVIATRRPVYRKALAADRCKRFSLGDLNAAPRPAPVKKAKPEVPAAEPSPELQQAMAEFRKWQKLAS